MWAPSRGSSSGSGRRTWRRRIADYLADDQTDASDNESFITAHSDEFGASTSAAGGGVGGGDAGAGGEGMLPAFLADQSDLVEVMLELDEESMVVRSVTPTAAALYGPTSLAGGGGGAHTPDAGRSLSRCSSTSSRIRRKFAWLRSPSPSPSQRHPPAPAATAAASDQQAVREAALAARERRRAQARLNRSRSGARRALKGLRFISRTTGSSAAAGDLWRRVEERFNGLAREGLLSRDDFGECIGTRRRRRPPQFALLDIHACELTARRLLASRRNGGLQGVRGGHLRRAGAAAAAEPGADHQGGALRLLAPDLRSELRRAAPDLLRHVLMS